MTRTITLPVPPSLNTYYRTVGGRILISKAGRLYKERAYYLALATGMRPIQKGVECILTVRWFRARKAGDIDNRSKSLLDSLQGAAYHNDSQVAELHIYRDDSDPKNPRVELTCTPL